MAWIYGYPIEDAARIALSTVSEYLKDHEEIEQVRFVLFSGSDLKIYEKAFEQAKKADL